MDSRSSLIEPVFTKATREELASTAFSDWLGSTEPEWFREYLKPTEAARSKELIKRYLAVFDRGGDIYLCHVNNSLSAAYALDEQQWDSNHFGIPCARIWPLCYKPNVDRSVLESCLQHAVELAKSKGITLLGRRLLSARLEEIRCLEQEGFYLADNVVTLAKTDPPAQKDAVAGVTLRRALEADRTPLMDMTKGAFGLSRFLTDPHISPEIGEAVYTSWMNNLFAAPEKRNQCIVAEKDGAIAGYIAYATDPTVDNTGRLETGSGIGEILLFAVDPAFRKQGIGSLLLAEAFDIFQKNGVRIVEATTWINSKGPLWAYQKAGMHVMENMMTFHKWMD